MNRPKAGVWKVPYSLYVQRGGVPPIHFWRMELGEYRRHKLNITQMLQQELRAAIRKGWYFRRPRNEIEMDTNRRVVEGLAKAYNCFERKVHVIAWEIRTGRTWAGLMRRNRSYATV
jgi:hypothetical protein